MYEVSASWAMARYTRAAGYCCPMWPGYAPRHPRLRRIVGRPERLHLPVPLEWREAITRFAGPAADFLLTLTPEEWAAGTFDEHRFKEWRSSLSRELRRECPPSPRVGAVIDYLRKRAEKEGRAAEADPVLTAVQKKFVDRGKAGLWVVVVDDPLSILEIGRAARTERGHSFESCQCYSPCGFSHDLSHGLVANLLDPGMAVLVVTARRATQRVRRPVARVILRLVRTYRASGGKFTWGVLVDRWYGPRAYERAAMEYLFRLAAGAGLEVFLPAKPYGTPECLAPQGPEVKLRGVRWINTCTAAVDDEDDGDDEERPVAPYLDQKASFTWKRLRFWSRGKRLVQLRGKGRKAVLRDEA